MREKGGRGKEGEENGREWGRGTEKKPGGKTEKGEMGEMVKRKRGKGEWGDRRREQFPSGGEQKTQKSPLYLDFPPLGIIIYMSKEYLIFKE